MNANSEPPKKARPAASVFNGEMGPDAKGQGARAMSRGIFDRRTLEAAFMLWGIAGTEQPISGIFDRRTSKAADALWRIATTEQPITLRGLFYRAVGAGVYPDTSQRHYEQCGRIVLELRRTDLLPYAWIVDSKRRRLKPSSWSGLDDYAETVAAAYRRDLWARQKDYIEFFI